MTKYKFKTKQIIKQGGSWAVLFNPSVMEHLEFNLGDFVDVEIEHSNRDELIENLEPKQHDLLLARLVGKKMKDLGVTSMKITLDETKGETKDETKRNKEE
jgi:antitoxin component of MazEF toxin-antitoxin module